MAFKWIKNITKYDYLDKQIRTELRLIVWNLALYRLMELRGICEMVLADW